MKTLELTEPGHFTWTEQEKPVLQNDREVLVKIRSIGICGTDIHAFHGRQPFFSYPRILGHELGVEVIETGASVTTLKPGDRCSVEPYLHCGACHPCLKGKTNCCEKLQVLGVHCDGGMTAFITLPENKLHKSDKLTFEQLALVETLAIGCHAVNRVQVSQDDKVLVIGAGPIGLTALEFASLTGAKTDIYDVNQTRLAFCEKQGKGEKQLYELPDENAYDVVFDATGNKQSMTEALKYVAHGGRLVFIGLFQGDYSFHDPYFHRKEVTLFSSRNALAGDFTRIIKLIENGELNIDYMISERIPFDEAPVFFESLSSRQGLIKGLIEVS